MKIDSSPVYLDASALAKLYVDEPGSDDLEHALLGRRDLLVSDLAITEIVSAASRRVRQRDLTQRDAARLHRQILADVTAGEFRRLELTISAHREAERLLLHLGTTTALRSADALHLALATLAPAAAFITYDRQLRDAAARTGGFELPS